MKKCLLEFCKSISLDEVGVCDTKLNKELEIKLLKRERLGWVTGMEEKDIEKRVNPKKIMEDSKSIVVVLFPYYTGEKLKGNLSKYTQSMDYHLVVKEKLNKITEYLMSEVENFEYMSFVDNGPLVERELAIKAGLCYWGINGNVINDRYGSYFFIGYIITNLELEADEPLEKTCIKCMKCVENCPGKVIHGDFELNPNMCKSYLTQKKGELSLEEIEIIKKDSLVFGCDICQDVCPHNRNICTTPIKEFKDDIMYSLNEEEIGDISNKEFKRRYYNRAFSWRGKGVIERNMRIISCDEAE